MNTIERALVISGIFIGAIYTMLALVLLYLIPRDQFPGYIRLLMPVFMLGSPIAFLIEIGSIWSLVRYWHAVKARFLLLLISVIGFLLTGICALGIISLWRIGPINPG